MVIGSLTVETEVDYVIEVFNVCDKWFARINTNQMMESLHALLLQTDEWHDENVDGKEKKQKDEKMTG